ncbi:cat eye syndrome critical region 2-like, partial [Brachionus plicatilis]
MEDLRRCWKMPYIVFYCNLFELKLDLIDLRVDEFEDALLDDCGNERNITIVHL